MSSTPLSRASAALAALTDPAERARARVGRVVLGKWQLDELLGTGGTSSVYAATHRNLSRVAIKMLHPELSAEPAVRGSFLREGYAANRVKHPGIVKVQDDDVTEDGAVFLVMDLLEGETLARLMERQRGRIDEMEAIRIAHDVTDILVAAHAAGIEHRDVTPKNVWIMPDGQIKLIDFGSAFVARNRQSGATITATPMGTPPYMAPELARGRFADVDARADVFSAGALLWTMLAGQPPRRADTVNEELLLAMSEPIASLGAVRPDLPQSLVALVDCAVAFEKANRWPTAGVFREMLRKASAELEKNPPAREIPKLSNADDTLECTLAMPLDEYPSLEDPPGEEERTLAMVDREPSGMRSVPPRAHPVSSTPPPSVSITREISRPMPAVIVQQPASGPLTFSAPPPSERTKVSAVSPTMPPAFLILPPSQSVRHAQLLAASIALVVTGLIALLVIALLR